MASRTLYLLRHAKAAAQEPGQTDFDRRLTPDGARHAAAVAALLAARSDPPALILCSSAQRTRETAAPLLPALGDHLAIEFSRRLYDAGAEDLLATIREQAGDISSLLLVGHNPAIEMLASLMIGSGGEASAVTRVRTKYPPAGLAIFSFDIGDWHQIAPGRGWLEAFQTPAN
jgi:phosphohistidine phosphatase